MANEINAIAGQLFGVPVGQVYTAGPGIVIDNVHKTVRVDETELWSGNTNIVTDNYVTLSEQASNFSIIQVQFGDNAGGWSTITLFPGTATRWAFTKAASNDASSCIMDIAEMSQYSSGSLKWIFRYPRRLTFNSNNTFSFINNAGTFYLKKIVGVNRISS